MHCWGVKGNLKMMLMQDVCRCVRVCMCIYLVVVYRAIRVVTSPYLYLSRFFFSCCTIFVFIIFSFSSFQVSILLWEKLYFFISVKQIFICNKSLLSLLSFSVFRCISFNFSSYVRF